MSLLAEINQRHIKFHADIARRAAEIMPKHPAARDVPIHTTTFDPKNIWPPAPRHYNHEPLWWHCMWFFDLVTEVTPLDDGILRVETIQKVVGGRFGVSKMDLLSGRRLAKVVRPRQIAMYLAKTLTGRSLPEIGRRFGGRDHTTVLHAVRKIEGLLEKDQGLAAVVASLKAELRSS